MLARVILCEKVKGNLGRRRGLVEEDLSAALVDLRHDLLLGEVAEANVPRAADVVEPTLVLIEHFYLF